MYLLYAYIYIKYYQFFFSLYRSDSNSSLGHREDLGERGKDIVGNNNGVLGIGCRTWTKKFLSANIEEGGKCLSQNPGKAASILCHVLVLNAWRRRRADVGQLQKTIDELVRQIEHLRLQIVVLRRLLETENGRVNKLSWETQRMKTQLEEHSQERDVLKKVKEIICLTLYASLFVALTKKKKTKTKK